MYNSEYMEKNEIKEMQEFFNSYLSRGKSNLATLQSLLNVIKKNKSQIEDDYILIESGILIISQFVFFSKLASAINVPELNNLKSIVKNMMDDYEKLLQNNYQVLDMNPDLIPQMEEMLANRFSQPKGFEDAELFMATIENIENIDTTITELNKKWKDLILF